MRIITDRFGVPHIYADTETDAMYGLGHAHAYNRLKQMFSSKLTAAGRISEIQGKDYLEQDIAYRRFQLEERAERILAELKPYIKEIIHAYSWGVNDFILANRNNIPQWIDQYNPHDVLAVFLMANLYFSLERLIN